MNDTPIGVLYEDRKRLIIRGDIKQWNQMLVETAHNAGVITNEEFAIFQNARNEDIDNEMLFMEKAIEEKPGGKFLFCIESQKNYRNNENKSMKNNEKH